jgi:hypothetical protein
MADADNIHAGFGVPLEYASQLEALASRRKLAQALQAQSLQPIQVPQYGPMASKLSPLAPLGQALATYLNQRNIFAADTERQKTLADVQAGGQREMGEVLGMSDPQARIAAALTSSYPGIRQQATVWQKARDSNLQEGAKAIAGQDPTTAMQMLSSGQFPQAPYTTPVPAPIEFGQSGEDRYALVPQPGGKRDFSWARRPDRVEVNTRLPTKEGETALSIGESSLKERRASAQAARSSLDAIQTAFGALEQGAASGGGESVIQALRKAAQAFGVNLPGTASADELRAALGEGVLAVARKLAPVTQNDVALLEQIKGSLNTDPSALSRMLSTTYAIGMRDVQDYHRWLKEKQGTAATDYLRNAFAGEGVGLELPPLRAPENTVLSIIQELQRRGGDTSGFTTPDGQPIRFNLSGNADLNPRIVPPAPAGVTVNPARRR